MATPRIPPHNLEAERSVLSALLVKRDAMDLIQSVGLQPEDFYREPHQKIFTVARDLFERNEAIDLLTLSNALKDRGWYDIVGGQDALTGIFEDHFAVVSNVYQYAKIVRDKATVRRVLDVCMKALADGYEGVEDVEGYLDEVETNLMQVSDQANNQAFAALSKVVLENISHIEELALSKRDVNGLATGFTDFDAVTTGLYPGQVIVIAARPGMGKTSWFLSALQHAAVRDSKVCALFSLEMSQEELGLRFLSQISKLNSRDLKNGKLSERDWRKLLEAADKLAKAPVFIDDQAGLSVMDIRARCRRLKQTQGRLDLVIVDYLQLMSAGKNNKALEANQNLKVSEISRNIKELAKELKVPIILLSQLNRAVESTSDKRPTLSHLRDSGAIEQDADMVVFIHRDEYYNKEKSELPGVAELIIAKNRAGPVQTVYLAWLGQYTLFENMAHEGRPVNTGSSSGGGGNSSGSKSRNAPAGSNHEQMPW